MGDHPYGYYDSDDYHRDCRKPHVSQEFKDALNELRDLKQIKLIDEEEYNRLVTKLVGFYF